MNEPALAIQTENLTRRFGDLIAVDNLSLIVDRGVIFGFLGPNGAGKSTTINMLISLLPPTAGTAKVGGFDITSDACLAHSSLHAVLGRSIRHPVHH